jgi:hypothetical protein
VALCQRLVTAGRAKVEQEHDSARNLDLVLDALTGLDAGSPTAAG